MRKTFFFIFIALQIFISACDLNPNRKVIFEVTAEGLSESDTVFISGNNLSLGNWNPHFTHLKKVKENTWNLDLDFTKDLEIEYKFTLGSWDREALNDENEPFQNFKFKAEKDTTIYYSFKNWKKATKLQTDGITGSVKYHQIELEGLLPRDLIVWLPVGYEKNSKDRYSVLYLLDGQNIFDPSTSFMGTDWQVDETATRLIMEKLIEPIIIVGIYNTKDRSNEYHDTSLGEKFRFGLIHKIKPLIDSVYRTKRESEYNTIGGSSSGGLCAFIIGWENPDVFSKAICFSPAFKIRDIDYVKNVRSYSGPKKPIKIYISIGGIDLEEKLKPGVEEMLKVLIDKGYVLNKDLFYSYYPEDTHNEKAWAGQIKPALIEFFIP